MAHDSRCENADTPPSDCDCECGGEKHGNGYAEEQIHDLQTDTRRVKQLQRLTPDEYFGEDGKGEALIAHIYARLNEELESGAADAAYGDRKEQLKDDIERLEKVAKAKGVTLDKGTYVLDEEYKERPRDSGHHTVLNITTEGQNIEVPVKNTSVDGIPEGNAEAVIFFEDKVVANYGDHEGTSYELTYTPHTEKWKVHDAPTSEVNDYTDIVSDENVLWTKDE
jgi:hypothetical protein